MPDPVIVAGQNYTVRKGESPFSIARTLLGRSATESQVAAFVQGQDWLRTLHPGEVLTVRPSEVMADAVPSANFMRVANAVTEAGGHKLPSNVTPTGVTPQDLLWRGGSVVGVRSGLGGAAPGQQAAQQQVAKNVQNPVKTPPPYAAQLARGPLGQPIPQPDFGIPQHSSRLIGAYAGSQVGVNRSVQNAQAGVKASPPAGALPIATQQLMANPAAFWGGGAAGATLPTRPGVTTALPSTPTAPSRPSGDPFERERYQFPADVRAAEQISTAMVDEAKRMAQSQGTQAPSLDIWPPTMSDSTKVMLGLADDDLRGLGYLRASNNHWVRDPQAALAYDLSLADDFTGSGLSDGYTRYGNPYGVYSSLASSSYALGYGGTRGQGTLGYGGGYQGYVAPEVAGAINWRIGFG